MPVGVAWSFALRARVGAGSTNILPEFELINRPTGP